MAGIKITAADVQVRSDGSTVIRNAGFTQLAKDDPEAAANLIGVSPSDLNITTDDAVEVTNGSPGQTVMDVNIWCDPGCK